MPDLFHTLNNVVRQILLLIQKIIAMLDNDQIEIKYVDQRHDGIEGWIKKGNGDWIRLDFMLEYFVSNNIEVTRKYKGRINDPVVAKSFYKELLNKFKKETDRGNNFDSNKYKNWLRNSSEIEKVRKLLS